VTGGTERAERRLARVVPYAIPFLGHALTLGWLLGAPLWISVVGLLAKPVCAQTLARHEGKEAIRAMAFEDES
jgi:hypothetical protein